jgi:hypothetical protein
MYGPMFALDTVIAALWLSQDSGSPHGPFIFVGI